MDCKDRDPATPVDRHASAMHQPTLNPTSEMRRRAEDLALAKLAKLPLSLQAPSLEDTRQLMHELAVHQAELEMQNDELGRVQQALEASRARYFDLYDLAPVGYLTVSAEGLILEANLTAATLFGVSRSALVKRPISRFIVKTQQDVFYQCRRQLMATGEAQTCELQMLHSEGSALWVGLTATVSHETEGAPVLRVVLSDISSRKLLDQSLQESKLKLESALFLADKANLAKSEFLSNMSHELRSPLNAILGFTQLLESGTPAPTPSQHASLQQILSGGWYLLTLINEILDLVQVESGKLSLSMEPVSLSEKFSDCQAMIEPQAQKSGIGVSFAPFESACFVQADHTRLKQVIINLVSNAIKYNRAGGTVDVTCSIPAAGRIRIRVIDTGAGLPPDKLDQLFQPFNRLGQESGTQEGTGIGLVVCKRLVEMMNGEIGVQSRVGIGSEFWFDLNLAAPLPTGAQEQASGPLKATVQQKAAPRNLLNVEDNPPNTERVKPPIARRADLARAVAPEPK
ncbi:PAS domain-containing sensor histidine kinase [Rhodoferax sp.]|uniref:PAS domain-containing sensor histidine kinase n=1 Tax=Rhodoferax sp. TaxID=50421 RepID=UPI00374D9923